MEINIPYMINTFFLALSGVPTTLLITVVSLLAASPIAYFMALAKINRTRVASQLVTVYVSCIRGTPMVLQILIIYSLLPSLLNNIIKRMGLGIDIFSLNPIIYAFIVFAISSSAGLSEIFRSGILTVDRGQLEAAHSVGISSVQAYLHIIIPQALVSALPNICSLTVNLIKGTSLAFLMTVKDVTAIAKVQAAYGYNYIESYLDIFIIYILVCSLTQFAFSFAEHKLGAYRKPVHTK